MPTNSSSSGSVHEVRRSRASSGACTARSANNNRKSLCMKYFEEFEPRMYHCTLCLEKNPNNDLVIKRNSHSSTTNFWTHLEQQHDQMYRQLKGKEPRSEQSTMKDHYRRVSKNSERFRGISFERTKEILVKLVSLTDQPWSFIDQPIFREAFWYSAQDEYRLPTSATIADFARVVHNAEKEKLKAKLDLTHFVSLSIDAWTTSNCIPLLGITVPWIDDSWDLQDNVLSITKLEGPHTGVNMAKIVIDVIKDFGLMKKISGITTDNASNNDTMMRALQKELSPTYPCADFACHMPCAAHIINLVVQAGLQGFRLPEAWMPDTFAAVVDEGSESIRVCTSSASIGDILYRVRKLIWTIRSSPQRRDRYREFCNALQMGLSAMPILDIPTRWNSTHDMLLSALSKQKALKKMALLVLSDDDVNYILGDAEWELIKHFCSLLKPFREATQYLCQSKVITSTKVFKLFNALQRRMDNLHRKINESYIFPPGLLLREQQRIVVTTALSTMMAKLRKYQDKMKGTFAFAYASLLDPQIKLDHIDDCVRARVLKQFQMILRGVKEVPNPCTKETKTNNKEPNLYDDEPLSLELDDMDAPQTTCIITAEEEISSYLRMPWLKENPLTWWSREGCKLIPRLGWFAKEFLSVCATSAPVERFFSSGRGICTYKRARLSTESIGLLMALKYWLRKEQPELLLDMEEDTHASIHEDGDYNEELAEGW